MYVFFAYRKVYNHVYYLPSNYSCYCYVMKKSKVVQKKSIPFKSKRPSFKILRIITMFVLGTVMILAIAGIIIKYYQLVTQK